MLIVLLCVCNPFQCIHHFHVTWKTKKRSEFHKFSKFLSNHETFQCQSSMSFISINFRPSARTWLAVANSNQLKPAWSSLVCMTKNSIVWLVASLQIQNSNNGIRNSWTYDTEPKISTSSFFYMYLETRGKF